MAKGVPVAFEGGGFPGLSFLKELVELGALKPATAGDTIDEVMGIGIENITPAGLVEYERCWGDQFRVNIGERGIDFCVGADPHGWKMRLKPIITRLSHVEGAAFVSALNASMVQGPVNWQTMSEFFGGEMFDQADEEDREARDDSPAGMALRVEGKANREDSDVWLANLFKSHPALFGTKPDGEQLLIKSIASKRPKDDGLRALIASFFAADSAVKAAGICGELALMVTTWDRDCPINHAHDFHCQQIHNGDWDHPQTESFEARCATIKEFSSHINLVGNLIAAAQALEEWTNAHC